MLWKQAMRFVWSSFMRSMSALQKGSLFIKTMDLTKDLRNLNSLSAKMTEESKMA